MMLETIPSNVVMVSITTSCFWCLVALLEDPLMGVAFAVSSEPYVDAVSGVDTLLPFSFPFCLVLMGIFGDAGCWLL